MTMSYHDDKSTKSGDESALAEALVRPDGYDDPDPASGETTWKRGEPQPNGCRDAWAAAVFIAQLLAMIGTALTIGIRAVKEFRDVESAEAAADGAGATDGDFSGVVNLAAVTAVAAWIISALSLVVMNAFAKVIIQMSLVFTVIVSLASCVYSFYIGSAIGGIVGILIFLLTVCYACLVRRRIPFAAANLKTALTAVRTNFGVTIAAYVFVLFSFLYALVWVTAFAGVYDATSDCTDGVCEQQMNGGYWFMLLLAGFWTQQVLQNTVHVTVAGVVATWWFHPPEASSCCSRGVKDSIVRSTTSSFGSICFGSLLVAFIKALRSLAQQSRESSDGVGMVLACIAECILSCLESIMEFFNKWAFVYVGMYGYGYIEAGRNVIELFKKRGWTVIINDDLVSNTLSLVSLTIGVATGCVGLILQQVYDDWFVALGDAATLTAFGLPFVLGLVISSVLLSVVDSAVNTVVVCFAEAPSEFEQNHSILSAQMVEAWCKVYPAECGF